MRRNGFCEGERRITMLEKRVLELSRCFNNDSLEQQKSSNVAKMLSEEREL
ncbi:hypothetical protein PGB90_008016 [Kerria lacca]